MRFIFVARRTPVYIRERSGCLKLTQPTTKPDTAICVPVAYTRGGQSVRLSLERLKGFALHGANERPVHCDWACGAGQVADDRQVYLPQPQLGF